MDLPLSQQSGSLSTLEPVLPHTCEALKPTMDLSSLSRPAILCQCVRCSSSLASLENEWARLSNSYLIAAGWLSVDLHRISISSEKKQVPQTSDLTVLRGRIIQEITCRLCQQKLGVLCALDHGPNILWKLSRVAFRDIVTMRTIEPTFRDGALERIIYRGANQSDVNSTRRDKTPSTQGALVPMDLPGGGSHDMSVQRQIQSQSYDINNISSSVNTLHGTMAEMKNAFTALRIELNGPGRASSEAVLSEAGGFDMVTTLLKDLKAKSDEIERLKLENEALKIKNRYMEEQATREPAIYQPIETSIREVESPGLLQESRKRPWPEEFPSGRTQPIADSFDGDDQGNGTDIVGDLTAANHQSVSVKIPLKDPAAPSTVAGDATNATSMEVNESEQPSPQFEIMTDRSRQSEPSSQPQEAITKRPRLSHASDQALTSGAPEKRGRGRPRKSSMFSTPRMEETSNPIPLSEQPGNTNGATQQEPQSIPTEQQGGPAESTRRSRGRPRRSRPRSKAPSTRRQTRQSVDADEHDDVPQSQESAHETPSVQNDSEKENPGPTVAQTDAQDSETAEKHKAQVAMRDTMVRLAMQREEAMETSGT